MLVQARWPRGFPSPACGSGQSRRLRRRKALQCIHCQHRTALTAGTLRAHPQLPPTTWCLALHLIPQAQNGLSARELRPQLGVSSNPAWRLNHKLRQALRERDDSQPLPGTGELDDASLGGAAGKTPSLAAAPGPPEGNPERVRLTPGPGCRQAAGRSWARRPLRPGTGVRSDGPGRFRGVRDAGCTPQPPVTGGGQGRCETPGRQGGPTLLGHIQRSLDATLHAGDAQYAGRYLGACAYRSNRRSQLQDCVPRLTSIAARTPPLPAHLLKLAGASW